ncbi:MAG: hypothetical protein GY800_01950 [Planctomycetes bacterium]|nr:hypothetical protein [Planctomycetota bacterium]
MKPQAELMRFVVTLDGGQGGKDGKDGEVIEGKPLGSLDTGWNDLPESPIRSLAYTNPYGDQILLQGYREYNHMVECVQHVGGRPYVTDVYLMGAVREDDKDKVIVYKITAFQKTDDDTVHAGDVSVRVYPRGKEYLGSETWGWRRGIEVEAD